MVIFGFDFCTLCCNVCFLQADPDTKILACLGEGYHQAFELSLFVSSVGIVVNKGHTVDYV